MKVMLRLLLRLIPIFGILVGVYTGLMILVQYIPNSVVEANISRSAEVLKKEGPRKVVIPGIFDRYRVLDGHTDCLMLGMALKPNGLSMTEAAMLNDCYCHLKEDGQPDGIMFPDDLFRAAHNDTEGLDLYRYGRCWNGYLVYLKPLLTIMDFNAIRLLNCILFILLMASCFCAIWKNISHAFAVAFLLSVVYFNYYLAPLCMQYMQGTILIFLSAFIVLTSRAVNKNIINTSVFFFVIGSIMAFIDVLTLPQLTLGVPLLFYCIRNKMNISLRDFIIICICWFAGFALTWASKFIVGSLLTGVNILSDAVHAAQVRTSTSMGAESLSIISIANALRILIPLFIIMICFIPYYLKHKSKNINFKKLIPLFLIFAIVPFWFAALSNHSFVHILFTYRAWLLPTLCVITYFYLTMEKPEKNIQ